jgi:RNA polymerase sigma factor (sigma-70 family)
MTLEELRTYLERSYPKLLAFALSLLGEGAADVLHKKVLQLLSYPERLAQVDPGRPGPYFFTVVRNAVRDHARAQARGPKSERLPEDYPDAKGPGPEGVAPADAAEQARAVVRAAVAGLTEKERRAFRACWQAGLVRSGALATLGLADGTDQERYKDYDGPLNRVIDMAEEAPEVNFDKEIVLVARTAGSKLTLKASLDEKRDLKALGLATRDLRKGFRYVIISVPKECVKTVNGKELPK